MTEQVAGLRCPVGSSKSLCQNGRMQLLRRARSPLRSVRPGLRRWLDPVVPVERSVAALRAYPAFLRSWRTYAGMDGAEVLHVSDGCPCLLDRVPTTPYDPHYFHQAVWAFEHIVANRPLEHVDVGSEITFVGMVSAFVPVAFVDIRPLPVDLPRLHSLKGDLLSLPFADASQSSVSCLHVAEHVGLGRYGDDLTPSGTRLACGELDRVLAPGGTLLFSLPVGRPRVCFNAHRVHAPAQILDYFDDLELLEFSVVDDEYTLIRDADPAAAERLSYGCGLFRFTRPDRS
jgi:hypothetical protein